MYTRAEGGSRTGSFPFAFDSSESVSAPESYGPGVAMWLGGRLTTRLSDAESGVASSRALPAWISRILLVARSEGRRDVLISCFRVAVFGDLSTGIESGRSGIAAEKRIVTSNVEVSLVVVFSKFRGDCLGSGCGFR